MASSLLFRGNASTNLLRAPLSRLISGPVFNDRLRVVILGTGWSSYRVAKQLDPNSFDVTIVSRRNHMLFTPLLASTTVGTLEFRSIAESVRSTVPSAKFYLAACRDILPESKTIMVQPEIGRDELGASHMKGEIAELPYDILVVGIGAASNTFGIPGVKEHVHFLKELADARRVRSKLLNLLEAASYPGLSDEEISRLLHVVIVGGGPTGVEFCAELSDFVRQDLKYLYPHVYHRVKLTLIDGGEILTAFKKSLRDYTMRKFRNRAIEVRLGATVSDVTDDAIHLSDGTAVDYGMIVWSTGVGPRGLVEKLSPRVFRKDRGGRLVTDSHLRVLQAGPGGEGEAAGAGDQAGSGEGQQQQGGGGGGGEMAVFPGMFAIGDCADVLGMNYPPTAQVAEQQGTHVAHTLHSVAAHWQGLKEEARSAGGRSASMSASEGERAQLVERALGAAAAAGAEGSAAAAAKPFAYRHLLSMAYVGGFEALTDFSSSNVRQIQQAGARSGLGAGLAEWVVWRSAYLSKSGMWRNRLQVPVDWFKTFFFGRDVSRF